jgi:hypothetical protein
MSRRTVTSHEDLCAFIKISRFFVEWEMFQTTVLEKIKMHILCSIAFSPENRAAYEITWKRMVRMVEPHRPHTTFWIGVTTVMWRLESALCTVFLERDFMRWSSVMWFWPFYHNVTDSRQVSPTTVPLADNGTFTFCYLWPCFGDTAFLVGNRVGR